MQQLINALEEVEQYHQIDSSLQVRARLAPICAMRCRRQEQVLSSVRRAHAACKRLCFTRNVVVSSIWILCLFLKPDHANLSPTTQNDPFLA